MFELNDIQKMIELAVRQFAEKELKPNIAKLESGELLPYDLLRKFSRTMGLGDQLRRSFKKKDPATESTTEKKPAKEMAAGALPGGLDPLIPSILFKEISRVSPGVCMAFVATLGAATAIATKGSDEQKQKYALPLYSMDKVGAWALTEPSSGSDAFGSMKTRVNMDGDTFVLNGTKTFISNAPFADVIVVYARLADGPAAGKVRAFILERGDAGLSTGTPMPKMGMWDSPTGEIFLDSVKVGADRLIGPIPGATEGSAGGRDDAKATLQHERAVMPAMCLGIIERCVEESVKFAADRTAFGNRIGHYQLIQEKLARMYISLENSRNLVFKLAWMQREGKLDDKVASAAKLYVSQEAVRVALDAVQIMGGTGYMREAPVEKLMRDAKMFEIGGGTSEIQLLTIARQMLREAGMDAGGMGGKK